MPNISYTYKHSSREDFSHDKSFSEEEFNKSLEKCFETEIRIKKIDVEFALEDHQKNPRIVCTINVFSPDMEFFTQETGYKFSETVRKAIKKVVEGVRQKAKKKHNH